MRKNLKYNKITSLNKETHIYQNIAALDSDSCTRQSYESQSIQNKVSKKVLECKSDSLLFFK